MVSRIFYGFYYYRFGTVFFYFLTFKTCTAVWHISCPIEKPKRKTMETQPYPQHAAFWKKKNSQNQKHSVCDEFYI